MSLISAVLLIYFLVKSKISGLMTILLKCRANRISELSDIVLNTFCHIWPLNVNLAVSLAVPSFPCTCLDILYYVCARFIMYRQVSFYAIFFLRDLALTRLENLCHFMNLRDNFRFNGIWQGRNMATLVSFWRQEESDVTVLPSVTCLD